MANHPRTGAPHHQPPKTHTTPLPIPHDPAQDDAQALKHQIESHQTIKTATTTRQPLEMEDPSDLQPDDPGSL
jgi:hypothetical protein